MSPQTARPAGHLARQSVHRGIQLFSLIKGHSSRSLIEMAIVRRKNELHASGAPHAIPRKPSSFTGMFVDLANQFLSALGRPLVKQHLSESTHLECEDVRFRLVPCSAI